MRLSRLLVYKSCLAKLSQTGVKSAENVPKLNCLVDVSNPETQAWPPKSQFTLEWMKGDFALNIDI